MMGSATIQKAWQVIKRMLQKVVLPGFSGVSLYQVLSFVIHEYNKDQVMTRANSAAFQLFLAIFPATIFIFTLLPYFNFTGDYIEMLKVSSKDIMPVNAHDYLFELIESVTEVNRTGLLSVGFLFAIIFSSSGMETLMNGFEKSYEKGFRHRNFIHMRLLAIGLTILISVLLVFSIVLIVFGQYLLQYLVTTFSWSTDFLQFLGNAKWVFIILIFYLMITVIYRYGGSMKSRTNWFNTGALLATLMSVGSSAAFSFFINNFGSYNKIYGSIGALIVLLLWLRLNTFIILIGYQFNIAIMMHQRGHISEIGR